MTRVPLPSGVATDILFAAQHTCCVCRVLGKPVKLHHIDENHSNNAIDNLAVLCQECHHQTQIQGGLARHLSHSEVANYRDDWHALVRRRRDEAAALAVEVMAGSQGARSDRPSLPAGEYIRTLPALRKRVYAVARTASGAGTLRPVEGSLAIIAVMQDALMTLASYYPQAHFGAGGARDYISELVVTRLRWHYHRYQPNGPGNDSRIVNESVAQSVAADTERLVVELVESLSPDSEGLDNPGFVNWKKEWDAAQHLQPRIDVEVSSGKRTVVTVTNRGEPFTLSMRGQLLKSSAEIEHSHAFEFLPRPLSEGDPITSYTIATVDAYGVVALYGEHLAVIQTWRCDGNQKLRFRLALTFLSNEQRRAQPVAKSVIEIECDPLSPGLKARMV